MLVFYVLVAQKNMPKMIPPEVKLRAKALFEAGFTIPQIVDACPGISPTVVRNWRDAGNWTLKNTDLSPLLPHVLAPETPTSEESAKKRKNKKRRTQKEDGDQTLMDFTQRCDELLVQRGLSMQLETIYKFEHAILDGLAVVLNDPISYVRELNLLSQVYERICKERRIIHGTANEIIRLEVSNLDTETLQKLATVDV